MKAIVIGLFLGVGFAIGQKATEAAIAYGAVKLAEYKLRNQKEDK